jgi:hypothetical protein
MPTSTGSDGQPFMCAPHSLGAPPARNRAETIAIMQAASVGPRSAVRPRPRTPPSPGSATLREVGCRALIASIGSVAVTDVGGDLRPYLPRWARADDAVRRGGRHESERG